MLDWAGRDVGASDGGMEGGGGGLENEDTDGEVEEDHSILAAEVAGPGEKAVTSAGLEGVEVGDYEAVEAWDPPA